jgi:site-specific DNA-cytosine methylase
MGVLLIFVSQGQIYKQFGNSVCINVITEIAHSMTSTLKKAILKTANTKAA